MKSFEQRCEDVAEGLGLEIVGTYEGETYQEPFEDDGMLHVMEGTTRVAFDVSEGQMLSAKLQNITTKKVLKALELKAEGGRVYR